MRDAPRMLRRGPAGKTRDGKIRRPPEKMDRAAFAAKPGAKFLKHAVGLNQKAPESIPKFRIVRAMLFVALERNRIWDFVRHGVNFDRQFELIQRGHDR